LADAVNRGRLAPSTSWRASFSDREGMSRTALRAAAQRLKSLTCLHGRKFCFQEVDGGDRRIGASTASARLAVLALTGGVDSARGFA
jgi:hypothetical protein